MLTLDNFFDDVDWPVGAYLAGAYGQPMNRAAERSAGNDLTRACCEWLGRRFAQPLTLSEIAAALGVSPFHLCRTFRRVSGMTLHAYRNELRLRSALEQLECGGDLGSGPYKDPFG